MRSRFTYPSDGTVTTTDATVTTLGQIDLTGRPGSLVRIRAWGMGRKSDGDTFFKEIEVAIKNVAGSVSIVGSAVVKGTINDVAMATCDFTLDVSGTRVRMRVTGVLATTIDWIGEMVVGAY